MTRSSALAVALFMRGHQGLAELRQVGFGSLADDKLVRVGPPVGPHRHRFPAEDELCAAFTKPTPAAQDFFGNPAARCAIPAFHGVDGATVADTLAIDGDAFRQASRAGRLQPATMRSSHGRSIPSAATWLRKSATVLSDGMRTNLSGSGMARWECDQEPRLADGVVEEGEIALARAPRAAAAEPVRARGSRPTSSSRHSAPFDPGAM